MAKNVCILYSKLRNWDDTNTTIVCTRSTTGCAAVLTLQACRLHRPQVDGTFLSKNLPVYIVMPHSLILNGERRKIDWRGYSTKVTMHFTATSKHEWKLNFRTTAQVKGDQCQQHAHKHNMLQPLQCTYMNEVFPQ